MKQFYRHFIQSIPFILSVFVVLFFPSHVLSSSKPFKWICEGHTQKIQTFLEENSPNFQDHKQRSLLSRAAYCGHQEICRLILERNPILDSEDEQGCTPLFHAACQNHPLIVSMLLSYGADVNHKNKDGVTPFHMACQKGYLEVVRRLMEETLVPVDASLTTTLYGQTALWLSFYKSHLDVSRYLLSFPCHQGQIDTPNHQGITPLWLGSYRGEDESVSLLLRYTTSLDLPCHKGLTPLMMASYEGHFSIVQKLMRAGANLALKSPSEGISSYAYAVKNNHLNIALFLKEEEDKQKFSLSQTPIETLMEKLTTVIEEQHHKRDEALLRHLSCLLTNTSLSSSQNPQGSSLSADDFLSLKQDIEENMNTSLSEMLATIEHKLDVHQKAMLRTWMPTQASASSHTF